MTTNNSSDFEMAEKIHQVHDKFFKLLMKDVRVAKDYLQAHVPKYILEKVNLNTLKLINCSFVDHGYKKTEADIIYSVQLNEGIGYFYLLCEHQTDIDKWTAFRVLGYTVKLLQQHRDQYPEDKKLPMVYPFVLYAGKSVWSEPLDVFKLFGEEENLARAIFLSPFQLVDLHRLDDDELMRHRLSGIMEFSLKNRAMRDFRQFLNVLLPWLNEITIEYKDSTMSELVLKYVVNGIETDDNKLLLEMSDKLLDERLRSTVMTLAQRFREEGVQQGVQQGEHTLLVKLLRHKFQMVPEKYHQKLSAANSEKLLFWGERILDAQSLEDVFED